MGKYTAKTVDTARHRRRIEQLVHNSYPGCTPVYVKTSAGAIAFRIRSGSGRYRSGVIRLPAHRTNAVLNKAWLERNVKFRSGPDTRPASTRA